MKKVWAGWFFYSMFSLFTSFMFIPLVMVFVDVTSYFYTGKQFTDVVWNDTRIMVVILFTAMGIGFSSIAVQIKNEFKL